MSHKNKKRERAAMQETQESTVGATFQETDQALNATQESLDKVRDILFGSQMREQDGRFVQLEEHIAEQFASFRAETKTQLESLQNFVKAELNAVTSRLNSESQQRQESVQRVGDESRHANQQLADRLNQTVQDLGNEAKAGFQQAAADLQSAKNTIDGRIAATEQQQSGAISDLRTQLFDQTNQLREDCKRHRGELQALVEKLVAELRSAKTDRSDLANLFTEMAGKLQS
jgi:hypothetical protein